MRALQAVVIVMGILIVFGLGLVVYGIGMRVAVPESGPASTGIEGALIGSWPGNAKLPRFGEATLALPGGAQIIDIAGVDRRLVLHITTGDGGEQLYVLDMATGEILGTIDLESGP